jgi:LPXTG-motif cell wall-anchored protein
MAGYEAIAGAFNGAINLSFPKIEKPDSVDKDALNNLITKAKKYGADDYTQDSFKALEAAITLAENVLQDDDATQDDVDQALAALQDAIDNLKDAAVPVVDKNALNNLITKAKKYEADDYTQDSFKALGAAIAHAEDVFQNEDATQDVVDQALAQLKVAIDNLKKAPIKEEVAKIPSKGSKSDFINEKGNSISIMNKGKRGTLPNTATNTFNYLALGITLLTLGAMSIVVTRRKKRSMSSK